MNEGRDAINQAGPEEEEVRALLDGGSESGEILLAALEICLDPLAPGQLLELVSAHPDALIEVPLWCQRSGHPLVCLEYSDGTTHLLIRKKHRKD